MGVRDSVEVRAARALQVVQNPEFIAAFEKRRDDIVSAMERLQLDGSAEKSGQAVELVRELQAATKLKAEFVRLIQAGDRAAKRADRDAVEKPFDPTDINPNNKGE